MQCPSCGRENPSDASFCNSCASVLELVCANCGRSNVPDARFCNGCAAPLADAPAPGPQTGAAPAQGLPRLEQPSSFANGRMPIGDSHGGPWPA